MSIIIHLSDLHFGPSYLPALGEAVLEDINTIIPDIVVVSGDLGLRARDSEFQRAREFLERVAKPTLAIPGNHDQVVFNIIERLVSPLARYRRHSSIWGVDLSLESSIYFAVGLNDNRPILPGGFWSRAQREWIERECARAPRGVARVLATHHQLEWNGWKPAGFWYPTLALEFLARCGVELVLNGHTHVPNAIQTSQGIVIARASTATCTRTQHGEGNSYNLITFDQKEISVCIRRYDTRAERFIAAQAFTFPRRPRIAH